MNRQWISPTIMINQSINRSITYTNQTIDNCLYTIFEKNRSSYSFRSKRIAKSFPPCLAWIHNPFAPLSGSPVAGSTTIKLLRPKNAQKPRGESDGADFFVQIRQPHTFPSVDPYVSQDGRNVKSIHKFLPNVSAQALSNHNAQRFDLVPNVQVVHRLFEQVTTHLSDILECLKNTNKQTRHCFTKHEDNNEKFETFLMPLFRNRRCVISNKMTPPVSTLLSYFQFLTKWTVNDEENSWTVRNSSP